VLFYAVVVEKSVENPGAYTSSSLREKHPFFYIKASRFKEQGVQPPQESSSFRKALRFHDFYYDHAIRVILRMYVLIHVGKEQQDIYRHVPYCPDNRTHEYIQINPADVGGVSIVHRWVPVTERNPA
jgi:hypothetical protein